MRFLTVCIAALCFAGLETGCSASCDDLKAQAIELKDELGVCSSGDDCVTARVLNDCLGGALVCGFPVPSSKLAEAESRAQVIADESRTCNPCAMADCADPGKPTCDTTAGRCVYPAP